MGTSQEQTLFLSLCSDLFVDINTLHYIGLYSEAHLCDSVSTVLSHRGQPKAWRESPSSAEMSGFKIMGLKGAGTAFIPRPGLLRSEKFASDFKGYFQACF